MRQYALLLKAYLKQTFRADLSAKEKKRKWGIFALLALCFVPLVVFVCFTVYKFTGYMVQLDIFEYFVSMLMSMSVLVVFVFGTVAFLSIMFYSKDNELALSLPVKTGTIFAARFTMVYLSEFFLSACFSLPTLITAGVAASKAGVAISAGYYIGSLMSAVFLPVIPLLIIGIIAFPLNYIVSFFRRSNVFSSIALIVLFVGFMAGFYALTFSGGNFFDADPDNAVSMLESYVAQFKTAGTVCYPTLVYSRMLLGINAGANFGIFAAILIGAAAIVTALAVLTFRRGLRSSLETVAVTKKKKIKERGRQGSQFKSLALREVKELFKNPVLTFQTLMNIIMPVLMIVLFATLKILNVEPTNDEGMIIKTNQQLVTMGMGMLFGIMMLCGMNYSALICVSREGENFSLLKTLPVKSGTIVRVKVFIADCDIAIGAVLLGLVLGIAGKQNIINVILFIVTLTGYGMSINAYGVYRDLKTPKLNWSNIKEITNRNYNLMVPMFLSLAVGFVAMITASVAGTAKNLPQIWAWTLFWCEIAVVDLLFWLIFRKRLWDNCEKMFDNIEP